MDDFKFKSLEELYLKLLPAFKVKVADLKRNKIFNINEENIWEYLKINYWQNKKDLTLGEMVNDILTVRCEELVNNIWKEDKTDDRFDY